MKPREVLKKLQDSSELTRKIILWGVTITIGVALFGWWFLNTKSSIENNESPSLREQFQLEALQKEFENIPVQINGGE